MPRRRRLRRNPDIDLNSMEGLSRAQQLGLPKLSDIYGIELGDVVARAYEILKIESDKSGVRSERELKIALDQAVTELLAKRREQQKVKARYGEATVEELRAVGAPTGRVMGADDTQQDTKDIREAFDDVGVSPEQWDIIRDQPKSNRDAALRGHSPQDGAIMQLAYAEAMYGVRFKDTAIQDALAAIDLADKDVGFDT